MGKIPETNFFAFSKSDLLAHFSMFVCLSSIFFVEKQRKNNKKLKFIENQKYLAAFIILGLLIEIFQPILSNRSRELFDFIADTVGCYAGYFVFVLFRKLFFKKNVGDCN